MPHIKYYGAIPPATISEHVHYEDPQEPCFRGQRETRVAVNTRCEDESVPRDQWDKHYYAHILESPYEGMEHVGGVGVVEDEFLRPFDSIISREEYEDLKSTIVSANAAYTDNSISNAS